MKIKNYIIPLLSLAAVLFTACSNDEPDVVTPVVPGESEVRLSGIMPAVGLANEIPIYLIAVLDTARNEQYITETRITSPASLDDTEQPLTFTSGTPYYPLARNVIRFFAYSGRAQNGYMYLTAGSTGSSDAVLSNYGRRVSNGSNVNTSYEGEVTPGSSNDPADLLKFRHVMTQLEVIIKVDSTEIPTFVDTPPTNVSFTLDSIALHGYYPVTAKAPTPLNNYTAEIAERTSGEYEIKEGINYLIPNGMTLSGKQFNTLKIDDYTATDDDLMGFTIHPDNTNTVNALLPGFSYTLTITVRRLKVVSATLTYVPWQRTEIKDGDISYDPNDLTLDLGNYVNSGADKITKVVLRTVNNRLYVGEAAKNGTAIQFVTLPTDNVDRVELYTSRGLLLMTEDNIVYGSNTLTLPLFEGGMFAEDPGVPYDDDDNPYMVTTAVQLLNVSKNLTQSYKLGVDIDLNALVEDGNGNFDGFGSFDGIFDGNGYWIANLNISNSGLFAENSGTLRNIRLFSGRFDATGQQYAGTICGRNTGMVVACLNEANIDNVTQFAGGIVGYNAGKILACINTGNIWDGNVVGGVCGYNANAVDGAIVSCLNTGELNVNATLLGGICGQSAPNTSAYVIKTSFWLEGTAQRFVGGSEYAVGSNCVGLLDSSDLDPLKMRNEIIAGEDESDRILLRLNSQIELDPTWGTVYEYIYDNKETGITWPAPVMK